MNLFVVCEDTQNNRMRSELFFVFLVFIHKLLYSTASSSHCNKLICNTIYCNLLFNVILSMFIFNWRLINLPYGTTNAIFQVIRLLSVHLQNKHQSVTLQSNYILFFFSFLHSFCFAVYLSDEDHALRLHISNTWKCEGQ